MHCLTRRTPMMQGLDVESCWSIIRTLAISVDMHLECLDCFRMHGPLSQAFQLKQENRKKIENAWFWIQCRVQLSESACQVNLDFFADLLSGSEGSSHMNIVPAVPNCFESCLSRMARRGLWQDLGRLEFLHAPIFCSCRLLNWKDTWEVTSFWLQQVVNWIDHDRPLSTYLRKWPCRVELLCHCLSTRADLAGHVDAMLFSPLAVANLRLFLV